MPSRSLYFFILSGKFAKFAIAKMPDKRVLRHKTGIISIGKTVFKTGIPYRKKATDR